MMGGMHRHPMILRKVVDYLRTPDEDEAEPATTSSWTGLNHNELVSCSSVRFYVVLEYNGTGSGSGLSPKWEKTGPNRTFKH